MAGVSDRGGKQSDNKQKVLDYVAEHLEKAFTSEELSQVTGMSPEDTEIAVEALAYEKELAKEYVEGGQKVYRRKA